MNISFYNAYTAMRAYQQSLDVVSNNLANVSTNGYKEVKSNFSDLLYTKLDQNGDHNMLQGHGVMLSSIDQRFSQGNLEATNYELDFAIMGQGFFAASRGEDDIIFTRDGSFRLGQDDGKFYLTRMDGSYILDEQMQRIEIEYNADTNEVDLSKLVDKIALYNFNNVYALQQAGSTSYKQTELSGEPMLIGKNGDTKLIQGALEASNVNMTDGMIAMMESQRAFQLNARVLQTSDEIEEMVNNLR